MPRLAVPVLGALLFIALTALWLTSSLWFFGTSGGPCHGSTFSVADGSPTGGPATAPLPQRAVSIEGGSIVAA